MNHGLSDQLIRLSVLLGNVALEKDILFLQNSVSVQTVQRALNDFR